MDQKPPSPSTSPNSSATSSASSNNGGAAAGGSLPPLTPRSMAASPSAGQNQNANPYPTTFIQADTQSFKQVVQMLTGSAETAAKRSPNSAPAANPGAKSSPIPPISRANKKPAFKLYERRSSMKNLKMIATGVAAAAAGPPAFSPRKQPEILSPSILDFPSLALSPVTPLSPDPFSRPSPHTPAAASALGPAAAAAAAAEDRAIAEKGFYLHPSPRATTPGGSDPPKLLPLFPLTSPRMESPSN